MTLERIAKLNVLTALSLTVDLGIDARKPLGDGQIAATAVGRQRAEELSLATERTEVVRLAKRVVALDLELKESQGRTVELIEASPAAPPLEVTGVGPVTAAVIYTAWSHLAWVPSEAAFAALAGLCPIPASRVIQSSTDLFEEETDV